MDPAYIVYLDGRNNFQIAELLRPFTVCQYNSATLGTHIPAMKNKPVKVKRKLKLMKLGNGSSIITSLISTVFNENVRRWGKQVPKVNQIKAFALKYNLNCK